MSDTIPYSTVINVEDITDDSELDIFDEEKEVELETLRSMNREHSEDTLPVSNMSSESNKELPAESYITAIIEQRRLVKESEVKKSKTLWKKIGGFFGYIYSVFYIVCLFVGVVFKSYILYEKMEKEIDSIKNSEYTD